MTTSIRTGAVLAVVIVSVTLVAKVAVRAGLIDGADPSARALMVLIGAYLVFAGNGIATTTLPRWIWIAAGLATIVTWLTVPLDVARIATAPLMIAGLAATIISVAWSCRGVRSA